MIQKRRKNKFLSDDSFIMWRLSGSEELAGYWEDYIEKHPAEEADLNQAIKQFSAVRLNDYRLDGTSQSTLFSRIMSTIMRRRLKYRLVATASVAAAVAAVTVKIFLAGSPGEQILPDMPGDTILGETLPQKNVQFVSGETVVDIAEAGFLEMTAEGSLSIPAENKVVASGAVRINKLIVPYGKQSTLVLSDGSKMWINSGSEVDFPSRFEENERSIRVSGEIYIEVAKDESRPFYVRSDDISVKVLGTEFNFSSYADGDSRQVVLVEGSVEVSSHNINCTLKPSQMITLAPGGKHSVETVNTEEYTSWRKGIFVFDQTSLYEVLEKVGRYYNIKFINHDSPRMQSLTCTGRLFLPGEADPVINTITVLSGTHYEKDENTIYIYRR